MDTKKPAPTGVGNGANFQSADTRNLVLPSQNFNAPDLARLGYLYRLADRQAHEAECFDEMRLAAKRYRDKPTPTNAISAHAAARRYVARR